MRKAVRSIMCNACAAITLVLAGCSTTVHTPRPKPDYQPKAEKSDEKSPSAAFGALSLGQRLSLVKEAEGWLGTRYQYGGHSKDGTDCSGMVMEVYREVLGIMLPRSSRDIAEYCGKIDFTTLELGDLVFFDTSSDHSGVSHVGLYVGDGKMIHASSSRGVIRSDINSPYYQNTYHSAGRVHGIKPTSPAPAPKIASEPIPSPTPTSRSEVDLDDIISQKIDSIYSPFFD